MGGTSIVELQVKLKAILFAIAVWFQHELRKWLLLKLIFNANRSTESKLQEELICKYALIW